jgi:processive 1,2-diacylglycerol beta-glucosyltransferase
MKLLILHASFGSGHKRAAEALSEALQKEGVEPEVRDLLEFLPAQMAKFYASAYNFMITKSRRLWWLTYHLVNLPKTPYSPAKAFTQKWQFEQLKIFVCGSNFTHVISTHFTTSALLSDWRSSGDLRSKVYSVVTDHEAHRCWKRTGLDHYFVASENVADQIRECGVPAECVSVTGIPISASFCTSPSRESARKQWNLPTDAKVVLVLCSALTVQSSARMLEEFAQIAEPVRYLVSAGHDTQKENQLRKQFQKDERFMIFGFSSQIAELMSASDLIVTKPGGLIVSEALAMGLPQILLEPIPGQEEVRRRYLFAAQTGHLHSNIKRHDLQSGEARANE